MEIIEVFGQCRSSIIDYWQRLFGQASAIAIDTIDIDNVGIVVDNTTATINASAHFVMEVLRWPLPREAIS